jgi:hypothetical protein
MLSAPDTKSDPHDLLEIAPDVVLVARAAADFPSLAPDAVGRPMEGEPNPGSGYSTASAPKVDTTFRATNVNEISRSLSSRGHWLRTSALAFLLALGGAFATAAWERYGNEAQSMATNLVPRIVATGTAWLPWQRPASAAQPDAAAPQAATADQAPPPVMPASRQADIGTPAPAAALPADAAQMLQSMSRDVANLTQQIEDLKTSIAQLKASQEQLSREIAKPAEPRVSEARVTEPRPKQLGAPPHPLGTLVRKPKRVVYPPTQAYVPPPPSAASPAPVPLTPSSGQVVAQPDDETVVRPPMPVR